MNRASQYFNCAKGAFYSPTSFDSSQKRMRPEPSFIRPLLQCLSFAECSQEMIVSTIVTLFHGSCPSAVLLVVPKIVIFPINAVLGRWRISHILKEILKGLFPSFAYANPAASVLVIAASILVAASLPHRAPDSIESAFALPMGCISFYANSALLLPVPASAGPAFLIPERLTFYFSYDATIALTSPKNGQRVSAIPLIENRPAAESESFKVYFFGHISPCMVHSYV